MDAAADISFAEENYRTDGNLSARESIHAYARPLTRGVPILDILDWTDVSAVLDVGCGNGKWLSEAEARSGGPIVGLDLSAGMSSAAARRATGAYLMQADAVDLPMSDGSFDRVLAMWMLYHVDDRDRAVSELRQVPRPGGQALVVTNGSSHLLELDRLVDAAGSDVLGRAVERCVPYHQKTRSRRTAVSNASSRRSSHCAICRWSIPEFASHTIFAISGFDVRRIQLLVSDVVIRFDVVRSAHDSDMAGAKAESRFG